VRPNILLNRRIHPARPRLWSSRQLTNPGARL